MTWRVWGSAFDGAVLATGVVMVRRGGMFRVGDHAEPGLDLDFAPFDAAGVRRIVGVSLAGGDGLSAAQAEALVGGLNAAAIWYRRARVADRAPSDRAVRDAIAGIARHAAALRDLLPLREERDPASGEACNPHVPDALARVLAPQVDRLAEVSRTAGARSIPEADPHDILAATGTDVLADIAEGIALLAAAAETALKALPAPAPKAAGSAERAFTTAAIGFYESVLGRTAGRSRDALTAAPRGPLLRYLAGCWDVLHPAVRDDPDEEPPAAETLVDWIKAYLKDRRTS